MGFTWSLDTWAVTVTLVAVSCLVPGTCKCVHHLNYKRPQIRSREFLFFFWMANGASTKAPMLTVPTVSSNMQTRTLSHKRLPCDTMGQKPNRLLFYLHIWKMKLGCSNSSQPSFLPAFQYIIISNFTHEDRHAQR